jgi:hypothetical protein
MTTFSYPVLFSERISFATVGESAVRGYTFSCRQAELLVAIVRVSGRGVGKEGDKELAKMSECRSKDGRISVRVS